MKRECRRLGDPKERVLMVDAEQLVALRVIVERVKQSWGRNEESSCYEVHCLFDWLSIDGRLLDIRSQQFLQHWLNGTGEELTLSAEEVRHLLEHKSPPEARHLKGEPDVTKQLAAVANIWRKRLLRAEEGAVGFSAFSAHLNACGSFRESVPHFCLECQGRCEWRGQEFRVEGDWTVYAEYRFGQGRITRIPPDLVIPDEWALAVEKKYGAKPFLISGCWHGSKSFPVLEGESYSGPTFEVIRDPNPDSESTA